MRFIDEVEIVAIGGAGGRGCVAFRREKYVPRGGPSGGDGGRGGHVVLRADRGLTTLLDLRYRPRLVAERGEHGRGKDQYGKSGEDLAVAVPVGTIVTDAATGERLADLDAHGAEMIAAHGGRGGLGNIHFATPTHRAPRTATPGEPGEERVLKLELRLLADVGVVGFPNAGKSSLIARLSAARPRIADYPFTTLVPQLGVVRIDEGASFVIADVPGLIEGAHRGAGLGTRFLRHLSRTTVLVHLLDLSPASGRDPVSDYDVIRRELALADEELAAKPEVVAANKLDLAEARERFPDVARRLGERGVEVIGISTATGEGLRDLVAAAARLLPARRNGAPPPGSERDEVSP
ncbi:MAG TPA: GTPase ObgE [Candidatus Binatia bacterium]|nr:GTPase ObgE [Candidatus Binatia bacterium]